MGSLKFGQNAKKPVPTKISCPPGNEVPPARIPARPATPRFILETQETICVSVITFPPLMVQARASRSQAESGPRARRGRTPAPLRRGASVQPIPGGKGGAGRSTALSDGETQEALRLRILGSADQRFCRQGLVRVNMDEIAAELGISKKTLYRHFRSRDELLSELVEQHMQAIDAAMKSICADAKQDPLKCLRALLDFIASAYREVSPVAFVDLEKYAPHLWEVVAAHRQKQIDTDFAGLIREGRKQGVFRKDVDPKIFLFLYSQSAQHVLNPEAFGKLGVSAHKVFECVCKVLFEGLLTERAR